VRLSVYDLVQYDFFGAVADGVYPVHPFKLICAFEGFCYAFLFGVLPDERFKHFRRFVIDFFEMVLQSAVQTHHADGGRAILLEKLIVPKAPDSDITDVQIHFFDLRFSIWFVLPEVKFGSPK